MLSSMDLATAWGLAKLILMFAIVVTPVYLVMRALVKLARLRYGFLPEPPDDGPPLRVCYNCNSSVLEQGFSHCPYCGEVLPPMPVVATTPLIAALDSGVGQSGATDGPSV